jgi:hypothetical protein
MISKTGERIGALAASVMAVYFAYLAWNFPAGGEQFPLFAAASIPNAGCGWAGPPEGPYCRSGTGRPWRNA